MSYKISRRSKINDTTSSTSKTTGALQVVGGISSEENLNIGGFIGITGTTNTVSIKVQPSTNAYNYNLPTTSGSSGEILTSAGGNTSPMTWTSTTGSGSIVLSSGPTFGVGGLTSTAGTTTLGTTTIGAITGTSASFSTTLNTTGLATFGAGGLTSTAGTTTLGATTIGAITGTSASFSNSTSSTTKTTGAVTVVGGIATEENLNVGGSIGLSGSTSGIISIKTQAVSGTYNYNLPTSAGTPGQILTSAGGLSAPMTWTTSGIGTVTSVDLSVPSFLSVSGNPVTSSGTIALSYSGTALPIANGGSGATTFTLNSVLLGSTSGSIQSPSTITYSSSTLTLPRITSNDGTASTSNSTGSLLLSGGLGISNTTDAISATNGGSITTAGGLAVAKKAFIGTDLTVSGNAGVGVSPTEKLQVDGKIKRKGFSYINSTTLVVPASTTNINYKIATTTDGIYSCRFKLVCIDQAFGSHQASTFEITNSFGNTNNGSPSINFLGSTLNPGNTGKINSIKFGCINDNNQELFINCTTGGSTFTIDIYLLEDTGNNMTLPTPASATPVGTVYTWPIPANISWLVGNNSTMCMTNTGNVGINTTTPTVSLDVSGTIRNNGGIVTAMNTTETSTGQTSMLIMPMSCQLFSASAAGVSTGVVSPLIGTSGTDFGGLYKNPPAQFDFWRTYINLVAGTYTFRLIYATSADRGIATILLNGTSVGTLDTYSASSTITIGEITGISVATSGVFKVELQVNTKNGSSSNYYLLWTSASFVRTS